MDPAELTRRIRTATPFIGTLGIEVVTAGEGRAELWLPMRAELAQDLGHPHGGVVGTLADVAANMAWRTPSVTVEYKVNFLRGAPADGLRAHAVLRREGRSISVAECEVHAERGGEATLVALCVATLAPIRRDRD